MSHQESVPNAKKWACEQLVILCLLILVIICILSFAGDLAAGNQTLITGILAVAGAWLTVQAVREQMSQSEKHFLDQLRRKSIAARAALPVSLNQVLSYLEQCIIHISNFRNMDVTSSNNYTEYRPCVVSEQPNFPTNAISTLRDCVEHAQNDEIAKKIARLIREIQAVTSSVSNFHAHYASYFDVGSLQARSRNVDQEIIRLVECSSLVRNFYPYADLDSETIDIKLNQENTEASWHSTVLKHRMGRPTLAQCMRRVDGQHHPNSNPIS